MAVEPRNPHRAAFFGHLLALSGQWAEAEAALRRAVALDAAEPRFRAALLGILAAAGAGDALAREAEAAARVFPDDPAIAGFAARARDAA